MSRKIGGDAVEQHVLIDISNILHRAFHSVFPNFNGGEPGAKSSRVTIRTLEILNSVLRGIPNKDKVCIFFDGKPERRIASYDAYKANRKSKNILDSIWEKTLVDGHFVRTELDLISHIFSLLGCDTYFNPSEEADDMIASYIKHNPGKVKVIISDDKDFFQLLSDPKVVILRPTSNEFIDADKSARFWIKDESGCDVKPEHVRMFKSLCGDPSDNIKGVFRLNKKTAASLCDARDIDDLLANKIGSLSHLDKQKIISSEQIIRRNWDLVSFNDTIDVSSYVTSGSKNIELARKVIENDLQSHVALSGFCRIDFAAKHALLPEWYNDL